MNPQPPETRQGARRILAYSQMGLQLALTAGAGAGAGLWADRHWGLSPWGLLAGSCAGAGVGLTVFILDALAWSRKDK